MQFAIEVSEWKIEIRNEQPQFKPVKPTMYLVFNHNDVNHHANVSTLKKINMWYYCDISKTFGFVQHKTGQVYIARLSTAIQTIHELDVIFANVPARRMKNPPQDRNPNMQTIISQKTCPMELEK